MKHFLLISFFSISCLSFSQTKSESLDYVFDSEVFKEERTISVFIPETYNSGDTTRKFNVAYLLDGQFQPYFSMVSSIMSYYSQTNEGIPLIIVGIHTNNRWGEFVPLCEEERTESTEGADKLSLFLKNEVIPLIESTYRTTQFKIGIGHSLGGTFVINEIVRDNSLFNAIIAVSPNLTMCNEQIIKRAQEFYDTQPNNLRFIYSSAGTVGDMENGFKNSLTRLDSITTKMNLKQMYWNCDVLEGANHMTTFVPTFDAGYLEISSRLSLMDADLIDMTKDSTSSIVSSLTDFYNNLSNFSEENIELSIDQIMKHATTLAQFGEYRACIDLCQYADGKLKKESISSDKKKEIAEMIESRKIRAEFNALAQEANKFAIAGDYVNASSLYIKAFDMGLIRATHMVRMDAIPVLAQAGEIEEAFVQLDLLANKFALGGNGSFISDTLCEPLHKDKRWKNLMDKLAENGGLYR
ncbi:MAG TPA: alpha/beta hydrolase [Crocinitomicaceae bacterium]|nr:alpha/beta hydrolase [Crocinitomicaceae bacterium]